MTPAQIQQALALVASLQAKLTEQQRTLDELRLALKHKLVADCPHTEVGDYHGRLGIGRVGHLSVCFGCRHAVTWDSRKERWYITTDAVAAGPIEGHIARV